MFVPLRSFNLAFLLLNFGSFALAQGNSAQNQPSRNDPIPRVQTTVTVNATLASEAPASITVLDQESIRETPGTNLDDRLRQVPGFSLFRRSSSVVANPTTQGVSLRASGSSGASRTLVLWDGIPINDPFGGWVYWTRIDPSYIDRVEIDRGASTSLFGDRAMGGTISLFSPQESFQSTQHQHVFANYFGGNENTHDVSAAYSNVWGRWGILLHSRDFTTGGYYITPEPFRGTADDRANVRFATGDLRVDYLLWEQIIHIPGVMIKSHSLRSIHASNITARTRGLPPTETQKRSHRARRSRRRISAAHYIGSITPKIEGSHGTPSRVRMLTTLMGLATTTRTAHRN
jgi:outer membrane cobalamin receptor